MPMFHVGQKVRVKRAYAELAEGDITEITNTGPGPQGMRMVVVSRYPDDWLSEGRFEPVDDEPAAEPPKMPRLNPRILPDDGKVREDYPLYDGLFAYFPAALCEVARWSKIGNDKHNPGQDMHWAREKSTDHENKILRHLLDARQLDEHGVVEAVALAWRSLALCQTILEERGWPEGANSRRSAS